MIFWTYQNVQKRPKTSTAPKTHVLGLEYEKPGNQVPIFEIFENMKKCSRKVSATNGSYDFPNELTRFPNEAKPIWGKIQKHCKNEVII